MEEEIITTYIDYSADLIITDIEQSTAETVEYIETTEKVLDNGLTYSENISQIADCSKGIFVFLFFFLVCLVCHFFYCVLRWFV